MILFPETLTVQCDGCQQPKEFAATEYCDNTLGVDDSVMEEDDWVCLGNDHYCPDCKESYE